MGEIARVNNIDIWWKDLNRGLFIPIHALWSIWAVASSLEACQRQAGVWAESCRRTTHMAEP